MFNIANSKDGTGTISTQHNLREKKWHEKLSNIEVFPKSVKNTVNTFRKQIKDRLILSLLLTIMFCDLCSQSFQMHLAFYTVTVNC